MVCIVIREQNVCQFSSPTAWVSGIKVQSSGLAASAFYPLIISTDQIFKTKNKMLIYSKFFFLIHEALSFDIMRVYVSYFLLLIQQLLCTLGKMSGDSLKPPGCLKPQTVHMSCFSYSCIPEIKC